MKFVPIFAVIAVISLPFVSLYGFNYGFNYGYWPQKYFSSYAFPRYYGGIKFFNNYLDPHYFGLFSHLNSYTVPQVIYPAFHYSYAPIFPSVYHKSFSYPFFPYGFGAHRIFGPGLITHPDYRPPTMWNRLWPSIDSKKNGTEETSTQPTDKDSDTQNDKTSTNGKEPAKDS